MPRYTRSISFAIIITRLLLDERGWRLEELRAQLDIAERTWRDWRQDLVENLPILRDAQGRSLLEEIGRGPERCVRLRRPEGAAAGQLRAIAVSHHEQVTLLGEHAAPAPPEAEGVGEV